MKNSNHNVNDSEVQMLLNEIWCLLNNLSPRHMNNDNMYVLLKNYGLICGYGQIIECITCLKINQRLGINQIGGYHMVRDKTALDRIRSYYRYFAKGQSKRQYKQGIPPKKSLWICGSSMGQNKMINAMIDKATKFGSRLTLTTIWNSRRFMIEPAMVVNIMPFN
ncbi:hypothetical protein RFI_25267 [Reticulomyxa filosa]|uniref:Uncharacterized protein n=1 Tax=Reticulomyxa filosa TaxID=46433 RepID=X6MFB2_RETFI|nr:hypothetical protein RFI_25267 [Reticulomyxa filosa]|eukprot:ETO12107.1 hypothetical protein RFI_25267 [Reticulomyxa filosa]